MEDADRRGVLPEALCVAENLRAAQARGDAARCFDLLEQARAQNLALPVRVLSRLRTPPQGLRQRWRYRRQRDLWQQVRRQAVYALARSGDPAAFTHLTSALFDTDADVQIAAELALRRAGDAALPALLACLKQGDWTVSGVRRVISLLARIENRQATSALVCLLKGSLPVESRRWTKQALIYPFRLILSLYLLGTLHLGLSYRDPESWFMALMTWLVFGPLPCCILYVLLILILFMPSAEARRASEQAKLARAAAGELSQCKDKRVLPSLLETALGGPKGARIPAQCALQALLPLLGPEDTGRFSDHFVRQLTSLLGNSSTTLVLAAVRALEFMGTGQTIRPMQRLAKWGADGVLRAETARVLPILEERQKQEQASALLLRGSAPPAASADELLRAAAGEPQTPPEQLLRPGQEQ